MIEPGKRMIKNPSGKTYLIKDVDVIPTGIEELDRLLVRNSPEQKPGVDLPGIYMIGGGPGTGKTLLALTLAQRACEFGAAVVYFTVEETPSEILRASSRIGLNLESCIASGKLAIVEFAPRRGLADESPYIFDYGDISGPEDLEAKLMDVIEEALGDLEEPAYYAFFFDSLPALTSIIPGIHKRDFLRVLKSSTAITYSLARVITEADFTVEQYVTKGIILLDMVKHVGGFVRYLMIPKMRARAHYTGPVPFEITSEGIKIYPPESGKYRELVEIIKKRFGRTYFGALFSAGSPWRGA